MAAKDAQIILPNKQDLRAGLRKAKAFFSPPVPIGQEFLILLLTNVTNHPTAPPICWEIKFLGPC